MKTLCAMLITAAVSQPVQEKTYTEKYLKPPFTKETKHYIIESYTGFKGTPLTKINITNPKQNYVFGMQEFKYNNKKYYYAGLKIHF